MADPSFAPPDPIPPFLRQSPDEMALPTETSKFGKVMAFLNRLNSAKNAAIMNAANGTPVIPGIERGLTGKTEASGADVLDFLRNKFPEKSGSITIQGHQYQLPKLDTPTPFGKMTQGFLFDVATDPLNALRVGEYTKIGKQLKAMTRMGEAGQEGKLANGAFEQLKNNQRSVASIAGLHTPAVINKAAGTAGVYAKNVANALPFADSIKNVFTPKFKALRTSMGFIQHGAEDFLNKIYGDKFVHSYQKTFQDGVKKIQQNPQETLGGMADYYLNDLKLNPSNSKDAKLIMQKEIQRHGEIPILQRQLTKNMAVAPGDFDPLAKLNLLKDNERFSQPSFSEASKLSDLMKTKYAQLAAVAKQAKLPLNTLELDEYMGRALSPEAKAAVLSSHGGSGNTLFNNLNTNPRLMKDYTTEQIERMFANPETRMAMFEHHFGNLPLQQKATLAGALLGKTKPGYLYETDPLKIFESKAANSAKAIAGAGEFQRLMKEGVLSKSRDAFKDARPIDVPAQYQKAIGDIKQLYAPENVAREFVKDASAFKPGSPIDKFMRSAGKATSAFKVGTLFGTPIMGTSTAAKYLFGHAFIANTHDALSNKGINYAIKAMPAFFRRTGLVEKGASGTQKFESMLDRIPGIPVAEAKGIDPVRYAKYIKDGRFNLAKLAEDRGMFMESGVRDTLTEPGALVDLPFASKKTFLPKAGKAIETLTGTGLAKNEGRAVDAFSRLQYAATKIMHDGYDPHAALDEARTNLYDYSGGLSDVEQKLGRLGVPFYSWIRLNTPAMAKAVIRKPSVASHVEQFKRNVESTTGRRPNGQDDIDERFLPSFLNKYPHIRMFLDEQGRWHYLNLAHFLPLADLEDYMSPSNAGDALMGGMNPAIKIPLEALTNKSTLFKKPGGEQADIESYPGEQGSLLGLPMRKLAVNSIEEAVPLTARLNRLNPFGLFGQQGLPNKLGATRDYSEMSTPEKFANLFALKASPTDQQRDIATAKQAYRDQLSKFKSGMNKAKYLGQDNRVEHIQKLIDKLNNQAIPIESEKHKPLFKFSR